MKKFIFIILLINVLLIFCYNNAKAIPAFARKYQTSCSTCHTIFPQLNPFGEAFRINGYQFPNDDDEKIKEKPVELGSEAYKRVFPDAVWPSSIPGSSPISFRGETAYQIATANGATTSQFMIPSLQVLGAGTFGKDISIWAGATLFNDGKVGNLDNFFIKFDNLFTNFLPDKALYFRVGQFIPEMVPFATHHRGLTVTPYAINTYNPDDPIMRGMFMAEHHHTGVVPYGIETFQIGAEASGVLASRFRYVAGMLNGGGTEDDVNSSRDYYGRLAYKFGGLAYDGTSKDSIENNGETSFAFGIFGYKGIGTDTTTNDYNFYRIGTDFNLTLKNLSFIGGIINGKDNVGDKEFYSLFFGEADYLFYTWLMGIVRYEQANVKGLNLPNKQIVVHCSALVVANIKCKIETRINPDDTKAYNMYLGIDFGF